MLLKTVLLVVYITSKIRRLNLVRNVTLNNNLIGITGVSGKLATKNSVAFIILVIKFMNIFLVIDIYTELRPRKSYK